MTRTTKTVNPACPTPPILSPGRTVDVTLLLQLYPLLRCGQSCIWGEDASFPPVFRLQPMGETGVPDTRHQRPRSALSPQEFPTRRPAGISLSKVQNPKMSFNAEKAVSATRIATRKMSFNAEKGVTNPGSSKYRDCGIFNDLTASVAVPRETVS